MTVLDELVAGALADASVRESRLPMSELEALLPSTPTLNPMPAFQAPGISVIAEVKRSSPSKGRLASIDDPAGLAESYQTGGASAISVLTEERRFSGSLADLDAVRARVNIPVLRKDFLTTRYQLLEARVHGADLALLIAGALSDAELRALHNYCEELGLTPLVEVHTIDEAHRVVDLGAVLVGVNNRDLRTLSVDLAHFAPMRAILPEDVTVVAESGILSPKDVRRVADEGADVILVGEALVVSGEPITTLGQFIESGAA